MMHIYTIVLIIRFGQYNKKNSEESKKQYQNQQIYAYFFTNFSERYLNTQARKKHQCITMCMKNLEMDKRKMTFTTIYTNN